MSETIFCKEHAARLTALADRLESRVTLHVGKFKYNTWFRKNKCGTAGCAAGEACLMWPDQFGPLIEYCGVDESAVKEWFGLSTQSEFNHLFVPNNQLPKLYGGRSLSSKATRQEVAAQIRAFLEYKAREQR